MVELPNAFLKATSSPLQVGYEVGLYLYWDPTVGRNTEVLLRFVHWSIGPFTTFLVSI